MTEPVGTRLDDLSRANIEHAVRRLTSKRAMDLDCDSLIVVPDASYPHHESTGLVTNPTVVAALCAELAPIVDDLFVLPAVGETVSASTPIDLLGYERHVDPAGASVLDPDSCSSRCVSVRVSTRQESAHRVTVTLPEPLVDQPVLTVPTLRGDTELVAPSMRTLATTVTDIVGAHTDWSWLPAVTATAIAAPRVSVLDGSYVFAGRPHRGRFLVAGPEPTAVDAVGANVLGFGPDETPALRARDWSGDYQYVDGLSTDALASELPEANSWATDGRDLQSRGYRLYARLTGDGVPPQLLDTEEA
jgi:uncharacterized protein (DUF362 family)